MKVLSSRKSRYVARVSIFLLALFLIAGTVSCGEVAPPTTQYELTIAIAPDGGGTATDLTNASPYPAGSAVSIKAEASGGYQFTGWTATGGTFADASAAETTFSMPAQNTTITANFFQGQLIRTWSDLDAIRSNLGGNYLLMNNLDSSTAGYAELASPTANGGKGWQPIGKYDSGNFTGTFDGQSYQIEGLFISRPEETRVGLFGSVGAAGVIKDIGVVGANVTGYEAVGGLVGGNYEGTVSNSYSTGGATAFLNVGGGLVGSNHGTVSNSYSTDSVTGHDNVGGLMGWSYGTVSNSYSTGSVTGNDNVGGLVGWSYATVTNSYSTGSVTGRYWVGGLAGGNSGTVSNGYSAGNVTGEEQVGGLIGRAAEGTVDKSYCTGSVVGHTWVGGLVGTAGGTVSNCYATGSVSGSDQVGGLAGNNWGTVNNSYSTGNVTGNTGVGGLVGAGGGTVTNSFWDTATSGQASSAGGTGKTTAEMKTIDTFQLAEWSITYVAGADKRNPGAYWNIVPGQTYPFLSWQP